MSQIEEFNRIRRIIFSTFHQGDEGQSNAFEYLEGYKNKLNVQSYVGLKAELGFYKKYRKQFSLTVSADVGDHTDFSGFMAKKAFRFDVTTNADYKKLRDYEPLQKDVDAKYKIVVVNHLGDIDELIDINFPFCPECGDGRLIDTVVLLPENYNKKGGSNWTNDQALIGICNCCHYIEEQKRISTHFLSDFKTEINNTLESSNDEIEYLEHLEKKSEFDVGKIIQSHANNVLPYLQKQFDKSIMALYDKSYIITNPKDGDGYNGLSLKWRKDLKLLEDYIVDECEIYIE